MFSLHVRELLFFMFVFVFQLSQFLFFIRCCTVCLVLFMFAFMYYCVNIGVCVCRFFCCVTLSVLFLSHALLLSYSMCGVEAKYLVKSGGNEQGTTYFFGFDGVEER